MKSLFQKLQSFSSIIAVLLLTGSPRPGSVIFTGNAMIIRTNTMPKKFRDDFGIIEDEEPKIVQFDYPAKIIETYRERLPNEEAVSFHELFSLKKYNQQWRYNKKYSRSYKNGKRQYQEWRKKQKRKDKIWRKKQREKNKKQKHPGFF